MYNKLSTAIICDQNSLLVFNFLIHKFPLHLLLPLSLQFISWGNQVACLVVFQSLKSADCLPMV